MKIKSILTPVSHPLAGSASLETAARRLEEEGATALPVLAGDGAFLGLVTARELVDVSVDNPDRAIETRVSEVMPAHTLTCMVGDDVMTLAERANEEGCEHAAVVDEQGGLVGVADLTPYLESSRERHRRDEALDEALDETFPASDPISPP